MATTTIFELVKDGKISPELFEFGMALNTYWLKVYDGIEDIKSDATKHECITNDAEFMSKLEQASDYAGNLIGLVEDMQNLVCEAALESDKERSDNN